MSKQAKKFRLEFNSKTTKNDLPSPPGYYSSSSQIHEKEVERDFDQSQLIMKKSWDVALQPIKSIPMNLLINYMAGNSISIFPIMMVMMALIRSIKAIFTSGQVFKGFEISSTIYLQKFVFFIGNLINVGLALYKCHTMGLLPTHASDWLAFVDAQNRIEFSDGGVVLI